MPTKKAKSKKKPIRTYVRNHPKRAALIALGVIAIAAIVLTDDDPPQTCPVQDAIHQEIDADQQLHKRDFSDDIGFTYEACWFQTSAGDNAMSLSVEIYTYDHDDGPIAKIEETTSDPPPYVIVEQSSLKTEDGGYWFVQNIPVGQTGERQELVRAHLDGKRLCVVTIRRPFNESTPDDLDHLEVAAERVASACVPADA